MSPVRQIFFCTAFAALIISSRAQSPAPPLPQNFSAPTNPLPTPLMPPMPQTLASPVTFFRQLLAMSAIERNAALTNRTPEMRDRIKVKIHEYLMLDPDERELRLRATELRWWLAPLFKVPSAERAARVALAPEELRGIITARLAQWDALPADLQKEFLDNDKTLHYFARVETTNAVAATAEQQKISAQFNQFFELTPEEKSLALNTLSTAERAVMEKTLQSFEKMPPQQRLKCVRNYAKFAGMTAAERSEFLKNSERWSQMSPKERQSWRDLVARVPLEPPLPPVATPLNLLPRPTPKVPRASVATN
jgi:hypothetical protein